MIQTLEPFPVETVPLRFDGRGGYLVGATRVPLDTVVGAYLDGATPEEIVDRYDVLALADVYAVLSYYWRHREMVHAYLTARETEARALPRPADDARWSRLRALRRERAAG